MRMIRPEHNNARRERRRGSVLIEFMIAGIASVTLMISTVEISLAMWNYHTLAYAVHEANRYITVHGKDCSMYSNSCLITVSDVANSFITNGLGLPANAVNVTLTSASGTVYNCAPITSCVSDATQWPPVGDNGPLAFTSVSASYTSGTGIISLWFRRAGSRIGSITLTSASTLQIVF